MKTQQFGQFKYSADFKNFYYEGKNFGPGIGFLSKFFHSDFRAIKNNLEDDIQEFFIKSKSVTFYETTIMHDVENNQIYIGIEPDCDDQTPNEAYDSMIAGKSSLEISQIQQLDYFKKEVWQSMHLSTDNFFYLLRTWHDLLQKKTPCILLYEDKNNKFDLMPFQSGKEMGRFLQEQTTTEALCIK